MSIPICNLMHTRSHRKHRYIWWYNHNTRKEGRMVARRHKKDVETFPRCAVPIRRRPKLKFGGQLKVCIKRTSDRISGLPDDILIKILSLLPLKEAGRTSLLSNRWRYVWSNLTVLDFDPGNMYSPSLMLDELTWDYKKLVLEEDRYVDWVDGVIRTHKAPVIDEFRVRFDLEQRCSGKNIDNWVTFAAQKRVKIFELDFGGFEECGHDFPYNLPATLSSLFNTLISLELAFVDVSGEHLEKFIHNCQSLELLSVTDSELLIDLKIAGPSLKLKSARIIRCWQLKHLEISAPNLTSFYYWGPKLDCPFKSTPNLTEFIACGLYGEHLLNDFSDFSSCISQIEVLTLHLPRGIDVMEEFPVCSRLKMLDVIFEPGFDDDLFRFASLIKACPLLHKFALQVEFPDDIKIEKTEGTKRRVVCPHEHLKIMEITGFVGCELDVGFLKYIMEIAVSLQKIIIDPHHPVDIREPKYVGTPWEFTKKEKVESARKVANQLTANLKPGIKMEIR